MTQFQGNKAAWIDNSSTQYVFAIPRGHKNYI